MGTNYREIQITFSNSEKIKQFLKRETLNVEYPWKSSCLFQKLMLSKSKSSKMLSGPLSISIFQNNFVLPDLRNVSQFASESCYNLRRPMIIANCRNPCYKMRGFHLVQNAATLITKCASYYKLRRYYEIPQNN